MDQYLYQLNFLFALAVSAVYSSPIELTSDPVLNQLRMEAWESRKELDQSEHIVLSICSIGLHNTSKN